MEFHPTKCEYIRFSRERVKSQLPSYMLHRELISQVKAIRYLGVHIQDNLKWHTHIDMITTKSSTTLGFIKRTIPFQYSQLRIRAYKQLDRPVLEMLRNPGTPSLRPSIPKSKLFNEDLHMRFLTFPVSAGNQPLSSSENLTGHHPKNKEVTDTYASSELCTLLR